MTRILSWNIQACRGVDGVVSPERIAAEIRRLGAPDLLCLQEVERRRAADQVVALQALLPDHQAFFGAAIDRLRGDGSRYLFGNLVLSRLPVLQVFHHPLPAPADPGTRHMPRQAVEVVVREADGAPLRVVTTHLEYASRTQRRAQLDRLRALHAEACADARQPGQDAPGTPYQRCPRPAAAVLCGDLNLTPADQEYGLLIAPFADLTAPLHDAWSLLHPGRPHPHSCGVHDHQQWPAPDTRDFFLVSAPLAGRVAGLEIDQRSQASDHQPLVLDLR